ncbi:MAG: hypothetical protein EBX37_19255, partial [Alphaproteobacteria bacterium]|nr:hypothetical protein [Alphaproteobacteria bacterium]
MNITALSVNVNKVATLRNTRHLGIPSLTRAATLCLQAGAHGITVHPRPDERHIRASDVPELAALVQQWPGREYNIEGNPFHNLMDVVADVRARGLPVHQVTFVPDAEGQFPVILAASPYSKEIQTMPMMPVGFSYARGWMESGDPNFYVRRGYVMAIATIRGSRGSGGTFGNIEPDPDTVKDLAEAIQWLGHQSWSSGKV